jgi:acyl CoA:acetate/3-ketoacid CoA transferase alpha subunit
MTELTSLSHAVAELVRDGDSVALEGFTHLIPFAAGHELLRQRRTELELIRMTPYLLYDQMVGMGAARKLVFSYGGNPGVGSLHRFRDAVEREWPQPTGIVLPAWVIDVVAGAPGGSRPSYSLGLVDRDNGFYKFWDGMSRDREAFVSWMNENVLGEVARR